MNVTILGLLSFPKYLFSAGTLEGYPNNAPMFRCSLMVKRNSPDHKKILTIIGNLNRDKWPKGIPSGHEIRCLVGCGEEAPDYVAVKGLNAENDRPRVIDQNNEEVVDKSYAISGKKAMMSFSIYAYSKSGNGISAGINGVKIMDDLGELGRLDGRVQLTDDQMFGSGQDEPATQGRKPLPESYILTTSGQEYWGTAEEAEQTDGWDAAKLLEGGYIVAGTPHAWE